MNNLFLAEQLDLGAKITAKERLWVSAPSQQLELLVFQG